MTWIAVIILCALAVAGPALHMRRKARARRLDPCDVIAWHEAKRKGQIR